MPSRILHLAVSSLLEEECVFRDTNRLRVGTVMPDAALTRAGHFPKITPDGRRTYDLTGFRAKYGDRLLSDELYLGYYLHLAEDIVQRQMLYGELGYTPTEENVPLLHRDYRLLNPCIIESYGLRDDMILPEGIEGEALCRDVPFRLPEFLAEMKKDFHPHDPPEPFFLFTPERADEFVLRAADAMLRELSALRRGSGFLDEDALSWKRRG